MKHLFLMDPLASIKTHKDTSYKLMLSAQVQGHEVYHGLFSDMYFKDEAFVRTKKLDVVVDKEILEQETINKKLDDFNYIWIRTDPPFDQAYLYATILLDSLTKAKVINRPQALRDFNEKLSILKYKEFIPWTLVAADYNLISAELETKGGRFVLKPLDGYAGKGIDFLSTTDLDWQSQLSSYLKNQTKSIMIQEYLPAAKLGDKRVLLWRGKALGAILRLHAEGSELNNLDAGGSAQPTEISPKEQEIIDAIGSDLDKHGLYFVGLDFIGEKLTEINVTSPTGLQEMCRFDEKDYDLDIMKNLP